MSIVRNLIRPTHRCNECGAYWVDWGDSWSLVSVECGQCCDNAEMGDQIERLIDKSPPSIQITIDSEAVQQMMGGGLGGGLLQAFMKQQTEPAPPDKNCCHGVPVDDPCFNCEQDERGEWENGQKED